MLVSHFWGVSLASALNKLLRLKEVFHCTLQRPSTFPYMGYVPREWENAEVPDATKIWKGAG